MVTSVVWDMWPTVKQVISLVQAACSRRRTSASSRFMGKGGSYLAPYHAWEDKLPDEVKAMVAERTKEIMDGTFRVPVDESTPQSE